MRELLENAYDPEEFRKTGHQVVDIIADYLTGAGQDTDHRVLDGKEPEDLYQQWKNDLPGMQEKEEYFNAVLSQSIHLHNPNYIGHQVPPAVPPAALIEMRSVECTKKMMSSNVQFLLKFYGEDLFREYLETTFNLAQEFAGVINN